MTRRHTIETERLAEDDGGEFVAASLAIEFNYTAPGPSGGRWNRAMGGYDQTAAEEQEQIEKGAEQELELRAQIAGVFADCRADIYLATVRRIVIEELNKLLPLAGEPEWQTKTPVPVPTLG
jgi:hypothetical protein